jgi:hypothetical protein
VILWLGSGAERLEVAGGGYLLGVSAAGGEGDAGAGQDIKAEVAAAFGPLIVLLGCCASSTCRLALAAIKELLVCDPVDAAEQIAAH